MITDSRTKPRIKTSTVFGGVMIMLATRLGSLNALKQEKEKKFWKKVVGSSIMQRTNDWESVFANIFGRDTKSSA